MLKILIADDQRLLRESFKNIIEYNSDIKVIGCASNGNEAIEFCEKFHPDVVLMDIAMPECSGIEATRIIKAKYPDIKVLILTASNEEPDVSEAIVNGANGYILKNIGTEELVLSIKSISMGLEIIQKDAFKPSTHHKCRETDKAKVKTLKIGGINITLTDREISIIQMLIDGKDNKEIGTSLFIAEGTVKNAITNIISKLQLKDRTQLAVYAIKNNIV